MSKITSHFKCLLLGLVLVTSATHAETNPLAEDYSLIPRSEIFPPEDGKLRPLQGKIINKRYHAPKNVFSCQAEDFGEGSYMAQDGLLDIAACVAFYNATAGFIKAEVMFVPELAHKTWNKELLKHGFDGFGIGILKDVDYARGITVLKEEMVGDKMFFAAVSVDKMGTLRAPDGSYPSATRGYLAFQAKDKLVLLSNQVVTLPGQMHTPEAHIDKLKREILEFSKTFEFGAIPERPAKKPAPTGS